MDHPVTTNRISALIYWLFLLIPGILQTVYNSFYHLLSVSDSLLDGLIFGSVFGVLGIAVWYVVRYNDPEKSAQGQMIASHAAASLVFTTIWMLTSGILAKSIISDPLYHNYLYGELTTRILAGLLFYALLVGVYYIYVYSQHNQEKAQKEAELQKQIREAQLNALKSQINPHFLFNSLNSIASLTLTNPENDMVTLDVELKNIALYLQIEKIRFENKLLYNFEIEEECKKHLIPSLILQPIFENAIKYGVYETSKPVVILCKAQKLQGFLEITIINDFDPESVPLKGEGIGLTNINERLTLIYGSSRLLTAELGDNNFKVTMVIPD